MSAWVVESPRPLSERPLRLVDLPVPIPGSGEVRVKVEACGVCHTDLHIAEGDLDLHRRPVVPGHQVVGVVDAVGPGASARLGDRVGLTWLASACGVCEFCREGRENLCESARFTGYDVHGGYAEYAVARAEFTVPIPSGLSPLDAAPLLCAGVIGYRSLRLSAARPGDRVGLVGFGASAHLVLQLARHMGCEVYVFTRAEHHRRHAAMLGAAWAGGIGETPPALCHSMVLFAPVGDLVPAALRHLRKGGTLAINAVHLSDIPAMPYGLLFGERTVRSVSHVTRQDAVEFLDLAAAGAVRAETQVFPFAQAHEALLAVKESRIAGAAVLKV